jgi:hypothetical protein
MKLIRCLIMRCTIMIALAHSSSVWAQTSFSYQGTLRNAGTLKNGDVDLQLRLFDANSAGAQIGSTLVLNDVAVTNGVFDVSLDFGAVFGGADRYLEIAVANSSAVGPSASYTALNPRQRIRAVPYASSVPDGAIVTSKLANQAVTSAKLAPNSVGSAQLANNAVGVAALADNAVDTAALQDQSVTNPKLADGSITGSKIAAGAIGAAQVNSSQVQLRINGECPLPLLMSGINSDGSVRCDVVSTNGITTLPAGGFPDPPPRIAIRPNGLPVILFRAKTPSNRMTLYFCHDVVCSSGSVRDAGNSARYFDFYIGSDDRARFFYGVNDALNGSTLFRRECSDSQCTSFSSATPVAPAGSGRLGTHVAIAVRSDGRPVIFGGSFVSNFVYELMICGDASCSSGNVTVPVPGNSGLSIVQSGVVLRADNTPVITTRQTAGSVQIDLYTYICADAACSTGATRTISTGANRFGIAARIPSSNIPEFYYSEPTIKRVACVDVACSALAAPSTVDSSVTGFTYVAVSARNGLSRALYSRTNEFVLAACNDASCTTSVLNTVTKANPTAAEDSAPTLWLRPDQRFAFASLDAIGSSDSLIRLYTCANADCAP